MPGRDRSFDVLKGILILLVVFGHLPRMRTCCDILEKIVAVVYTFHMPAFVIISGWFFGMKKLSGVDFLKVFDRMFKPYIAASVVFALFYFSASKVGFSCSARMEEQGFLARIAGILCGQGGGALWYLHTIGLAQIMTLLGMAFVAKFVERGPMNDVIGGALVALACMGLGRIGFGSHAFLIVYFIGGYLARKYCLEFPAGRLAVILMIAVAMSGQVRADNQLWGWSVFLVLLGGIRIVIERFKRAGEWIGWLGRHTLVIFLFHPVFSVALRPMSKTVLVFEPTGIGLDVLLLTLIVGCCLLLEWCIKKTPARYLFFPVH